MTTQLRKHFALCRTILDMLEQANGFRGGGVRLSFCRALLTVHPLVGFRVARYWNAGKVAPRGRQLIGFGPTAQADSCSPRPSFSIGSMPLRNLAQPGLNDASNEVLCLIQKGKRLSHSLKRVRTLPAIRGAVLLRASMECTGRSDCHPLHATTAAITTSVVHVPVVVRRIGSVRRLSRPGGHLDAADEREDDEYRGEPSMQVH